MYGIGRCSLGHQSNSEAETVSDNFVQRIFQHQRKRDGYKSIEINQHMSIYSLLSQASHAIPLTSGLTQHPSDIAAGPVGDGHVSDHGIDTTGTGEDRRIDHI